MASETTKSVARKIRVYTILFLIIALVLGFGYRWYTDYNSYEKTDDAYIDADRVSVSSKMMGRISNIYAAEGDSVSAGKLLVEIDSTDMVAQRFQAETAVIQFKTASTQSLARYTLDQKSLNVQEVSLERAKEDLDRATKQLDGNVITKEQFDHIKKNWEAAKAQLEVMKAQIVVSKSAIANAEQSIKMAESQLNTIKTQLNNTRIYAPSHGRIAKRWLLPGDILQPGQSVFTITKSDSLYVTAFFEETKVASLHIGQPVQFTVDSYPGITFSGAITYIANNTAAQFSLIPANNASGNFTKVTQRIPIRMSINKLENKGQYTTIKLVAGMSAFIKIPH